MGTRRRPGRPTPHPAPGARPAGRRRRLLAPAGVAAMAVAGASSLTGCWPEPEPLPPPFRVDRTVWFDGLVVRLDEGRTIREPVGMDEVREHVAIATEVANDGDDLAAADPAARATDPGPVCYVERNGLQIDTCRLSLPALATGERTPVTLVLGTGVNRPGAVLVLGDGHHRQARLALPAGPVEALEPVAQDARPEVTNESLAVTVERAVVRFDDPLGPERAQAAPGRAFLDMTATFRSNRATDVVVSDSDVRLELPDGRTQSARDLQASVPAGGGVTERFVFPVPAPAVGTYHLRLGPGPARSAGFPLTSAAAVSPSPPALPGGGDPAGR